MADPNPYKPTETAPKSSSSPAKPGKKIPWTTVTWLICIIAAIGFAFDIYELLMLPLIARPALMELGGLKPSDPGFKTWISLLFYIPAVAGGIFGLLGGYLTDLLGRRRVLTWSILLYAFAAFAAGFSTNLYMLLFFRCLVFIGVCVEFVAAVAWLAELFSDPQEREGVLGFTQAFSSIGGLLVAVANSLAIAWAQNKQAELYFGITVPAVQLPAITLPGFLSFLGTIQDSHAAWRYTLMSGLIPAIPLILIRPFLPESPAWAKKREAGTLRRPSIRELFSPELRNTTIIVTLMFACSFGAAFGAIQQMPQIVPGLPEVKAQIAEKNKTFDEGGQAKLEAELQAQGKTPEQIAGAVKGRKAGIAGSVVQEEAAHATKTQEIGGLVGRFAIAAMMLIVVSRPMLLRMFLIPGLVVMPIVFGWAAVTSLTYLEYGMFLAGFFTVAQFSFWGNYLPHAYPVHLRGTGESFAANIGGRLIGTCFAAVTQWIAFYLPGSAPAEHKVAYTAAGVAVAVYLINFIASFWLPEIKPEEMEH